MSAFKRQRRNAIRPNSNQYADLLMFSNEQRLGSSTLTAAQDDGGVQESKSGDYGDSLGAGSIASTSIVFQNVDTLVDDDSASEKSEKDSDDDSDSNNEDEGEGDDDKLEEGVPDNNTNETVEESSS